MAGAGSCDCASAACDVSAGSDVDAGGVTRNSTPRVAAFGIGAGTLPAAVGAALAGASCTAAACSGATGATGTSCGAAASAAVGNGTPRVRASCDCACCSCGVGSCHAPAETVADNSIAGSSQHALVLRACIETARWRAAWVIKTIVRCAAGRNAGHLWRPRRAQPYAVGAMPLAWHWPLDGRCARGIS